MPSAIWFLLAQGLLGAFDTIYYHEYRARLPGLGPPARSELRLHATRDFIYAVLFLTLPFSCWNGLWAWVLAAMLLVEIVITLSDFVVEDAVRKSLGGVYKGERVTHGVMGILYGLFLAQLVPQLLEWARKPTGFTMRADPARFPISFLMVLLGVGVSRVRDPRSGS